MKPIAIYVCHLCRESNKTLYKVSKDLYACKQHLGEKIGKKEGSKVKL